MVAVVRAAMGPAGCRKEGPTYFFRRSRWEFVVLPPLATPVSDRLLPDYRFRLMVVRKGSFFSILAVFAIVPNGRL